MAATDTPAKPLSGRIPSLDGLRGLAILTVVIGHGAYALGWLASLGVTVKNITITPITFLGNGHLGVTVFFVLSGFLIFNLSAREFQKTGEFSWKLFYLRRVLRIFPCFYFFIAVVLVLKCLGLLNLTPQMLLGAGTFSLNYLHLWYNIPGGNDYFVIGHYWTLCLEEQFYLTWPVLMLLFTRRKLVPVLLVIVVLAPLIRVACYHFMPGSRGQLGMMFHTAFDSIATGVLLGELLLRPNFKNWLVKIAANRLILSVAMIFPVVISPLLESRFHGAYSMPIGNSMELICISIVIIAAVSFPGTILYNFLNWRPLAYVGVLSYSLYVWNNFFLDKDGHWLINRFPLNFLCAFGMALASHYFVEKPFLRLKDHLHKTEATRRANAEQSYA